MAKAKTKSASAQKVSGGKGKMHGFQGVGTQKPGVTSVAPKGKGRK